MQGLCPFGEIIAGRASQEVVAYEDESVVAFLCEPPAMWGHLLIVPRPHRSDIWSIRPEEATAVMTAAHVLARVA